jgi:hypothetical protein
MFEKIGNLPAEAATVVSKINYKETELYILLTVHPEAILDLQPT